MTINRFLQIMGLISESSRASKQTVQQAQICFTLHPSELSNAQKLYSGLRHWFLESFNKDRNFQMSVDGLEKETWLFRGRVRLRNEVHLRNARTRVRKILLKCHASLGLSPASNQEFGKYLEKELQVTLDAAPFSGESHWWTPESPPAVLTDSSVDQQPRPPLARPQRQGLSSERRRG